MSESSFLRIEVTLPGGGLLRPFHKIFNRKLRAANKEINNRLQRAIKQEHRYRHRTRNLRDATKSKGFVTNKNGLIIYVNEGKAPYAKFIIHGQRTWQPDPYLDKALEDHKDWIIATLQKATNNAVLDFNSK